MKLIKKLLAMALAGVMLLTILTGCSGGKTGDRLAEEYMATFLSEDPAFGLCGLPITHDVPEIEIVAEKFNPSWLENGLHNIPAADKSTLREVFSKYSSGYAVNLYACKVDSTQSELNQTVRVMSTFSSGLRICPAQGLSSPTSATAVKCATRLVTRGNTSYRIAVIIYDYPVD